MAKAKKTTRKSATSSSKKGKAKEEKKEKTTKTKKDIELVCEFCNKSMKDSKTKKLHERSCKKKKETIKPKKKKDETKDLDKAILKIKDEFEDQRQLLSEQFKEREEKLYGELEDIKEVLKMEIESRREQERRKAEKAKVPVEETPAAPAQTVAEPETVIESPPKAIDMIPMPVPVIPKPSIEEKPEPPVAETGQIAAEESEERATPKTEFQKEDILELIRTEVESFAAGQREIEVGGMPNLETIESELKSLSDELKNIRRKMETNTSELTTKIEDGNVKSEFKRIDRELGKFTERTSDIMDEIGFGEQLNVSKIPPTILEIVYQATLDDLTAELIRVVGSQDAERLSRRALEEVRLKTSGSELFKFDGRKIVTDNLAYSIEANLISAKQIQTTYDELQGRLLEHLPHYKAKNFRAMIKVKSQEFAVDRATMLTKEFERMERVLESSNQMLAALSAQINAKNLEIQEEINEIKNILIANKADLTDVEFVKGKLKEREEREASLMSELGLLKAEMEMSKKVAKKDEKPPKMKPDTEKKKEMVEDEEATSIKEEKKKEDETDTSKLEKEILDAITKGANSKTALIKETGQEETLILDVISKLVKDKKVIEKKVGKRVKYLTPEKEITDMLKEETKEKEKEKKEPKSNNEEDKVEKKKKEKPAKKEKVEEPAVEEKPEPEEKKPEKKKPKKKKETKKPESKKEIKEEDKPKKPKKEEKAVVKEETKEETPEEVKKKPEKKKEEKPKAKEKKDELEDVLGPEVEDVQVKEPEAPKPPKEEASAEEPVKEDIAAPKMTKILEELTEEEKKVLGAITEDGVTRSGIQSKMEKDMKYTSVLRALRILIDSGYVEIVTKGRLTLYKKIRVEKVEKQNEDRNKKEVK